MKNKLMNQNVIRAISIGLAAVMATTPMTAFAAEDETNDTQSNQGVDSAKQDHSTETTKNENDVAEPLTEIKNEYSEALSTEDTDTTDTYGDVALSLINITSGSADTNGTDGIDDLNIANDEAAAAKEEYVDVLDDTANALDVVDDAIDQVVNGGSEQPDTDTDNAGVSGEKENGSVADATETRLEDLTAEMNAKEEAAGQQAEQLKKAAEDVKKSTEGNANAAKTAASEAASAATREAVDQAAADAKVQADEAKAKSENLAAELEKVDEALVDAEQLVDAAEEALEAANAAAKAAQQELNDLLKANGLLDENGNALSIYTYTTDEGGDQIQELRTDLKGDVAAAIAAAQATVDAAQTELDQASADFSKANIEVSLLENIQKMNETISSSEYDANKNYWRDTQDICENLVKYQIMQDDVNGEIDYNTFEFTDWYYDEATKGDFYNKNYVGLTYDRTVTNADGTTTTETVTRWFNYHRNDETTNKKGTDQTISVYEVEKADITWNLVISNRYCVNENSINYTKELADLNSLKTACSDEDKIKRYDEKISLLQQMQTIEVTSWDNYDPMFKALVKYKILSEDANGDVDYDTLYFGKWRSNNGNGYLSVSYQQKVRDENGKYVLDAAGNPKTETVKRQFCCTNEGTDWKWNCNLVEKTWKSSKTATIQKVENKNVYISQKIVEYSEEKAAAAAQEKAKTAYDEAKTKKENAENLYTKLLAALDNLQNLQAAAKVNKEALDAANKTVETLRSAYNTAKEDADTAAANTAAAQAYAEQAEAAAASWTDSTPSSASDTGDIVYAADTADGGSTAIAAAIAAATPADTVIMDEVVSMAATPEVVTIEEEPVALAAATGAQTTSLSAGETQSAESLVTIEDEAVAAADSVDALIAEAEDVTGGLVTIEDAEAPLAATLMDVTEQERAQMSWWWLLVVTVMGSTGYAMYRNSRQKKAEQEGRTHGRTKKD